MKTHRNDGGRPPDMCKEERDQRNGVYNEDETAPEDLIPDPSLRSAVEAIIVAVPLKRADGCEGVL